LTEVTNSRSSERSGAVDRLRGALDLHIHSGADRVERLLSDDEAAGEALACGMRGVLLKSHTRCTLEGCLDTARTPEGARVAFASLVLNSPQYFADGDAVSRALRDGVRVLYMPTTMAENSANPLNADRARMFLSRGGRPVSGLPPILESAARYNRTVATGHAGARDRQAVLAACSRAGVRTVLVTHPEYHVTKMSLDEQRRIAQRFPNVLFERTLYSIIDEAAAREEPGRMRLVPERLERMVEAIREIGPERTVLTSDLGQAFLPRPTEGFAIFLDALAGEGIPEADIELMTKVNPLRCLGLYDEMFAEVLRLAFEKGRGGFRTPFREPLLGWTRADDPLFAEFRRCVGPDHLRPEDALPGAGSVLSVFLPFGEELVSGNRAGARPSPEWCRAYTEANAFLDVLTGSLGGAAERCGFAFVRSQAAHHLTGRHDPDIDPALLRSGWSQRHVAYACGLGTFGMNRLIITEKGCAGRFSSLITTAPLPPRERVEEERCLAKAGYGCGVCISRCPAGALGSGGFDRVKCWKYLVEQNEVSRGHGLPVVNVCGKCSAGTPCALRVPKRP